MSHRLGKSLAYALKVRNRLKGVIANQYAYFCFVVTVSLMVIGIIPGLSLLYYQGTLEVDFEDELWMNQFMSQTTASPLPPPVSGECMCNCSN